MRRVLAVVICLMLTAPATAQPSPYPDKPYAVIEAGGPSAVVRRVAFTPDGKHLLLAGKDKVLRIWDLAAAQTVRVIRPPIGLGSDGVIQALAVAPDGQRAAIGGLLRGAANRPGTVVYIVALDSGRFEATLDVPNAIVNSVAFAPDGRRLAVADGAGKIHIFDVSNAADRRPPLTFRAHDDRVRRVAFSPDGLKLASIGYDWTARVCSAHSGKVEADLRDAKASPLSVAWRPDGRLIAVGNREGTISLFAPDGKLQKTLPSIPVAPHTAHDLTSVTFLPNGRELMFTSVNQTATIIDVETGRPRNTNRLHNDTIQDGTVSADGLLAASTGNQDHETYVWRTSDFYLVSIIAGSARVPRNIGWAPDGKSIRWNHLKRRTDPVDDREWRAFDVGALQFVEPYAEKVVLHDRHGNRSLRNIKNEYLQIKDGEKIVGELKPPAAFGPLRSYCWLKDGRVVIGCAFGLVLMDPDSGKALCNFVGHSDELGRIAPSPDGRYFVTASADMTMRIWSPEQSRPLLSLFAAEPDWIAWTEEGFYACSANGERLIGWQLNKGVSEAGNYYPAAQFRRSLYQPEMIRNLLAAGSVAEAFKKAGKKPPAIDSVADVAPPRVTITSPSGLGTVRLTENKFMVRAVAQSMGKHPVTGLRLLVDGRPFQGKDGLRTIDKPALGEVSASWTVDVPAGVHHLAVVAESAVSRALSHGVEVAVQGAAKVKSNLYILAVGISNYPSPMQLDYAADDADGIVAVLKEQGRMLHGNIEINLIKDRKASKVGVEDGLAWLASKMTAQDVGVFFFAGHGSRDKAGAFYMIPVDANPNDIPGTSISGEFLKAKMGEMPGRLIAMLDTCHSGAARNNTTLPETPDELIRDLVGEDYGVIVMSSSQGQEFSLESSKLGQGFFTYALMKGMEGKADWNKDGVVYLGELDFFTSRGVRGMTAGRQNPVMARPATVNSFPLAAYTIPAPVKVAAPIKETTTAKRPSVTDPRKALELDDRLRAKVTARLRNARPQHVLAYLQKATGLTMRMDENIDTLAPIGSNIDWSDLPAWDGMFQLASYVQGSWEKVDDGYWLIGKKGGLGRPPQANYPPFKDDTNDPLLKDPRLQVKVALRRQNVRVDDFLETLQGKTGLMFITENVDTITPVFGSIDFSNMPAWDFMRRLAESPRVQGTWEKTADGYRLLGTHTPAPKAATPRASGSAVQPTPAKVSESGFAWGILGGALGVLFGIGVLLFVWKRRKNA